MAQKGLGRGLGALLGDISEPVSAGKETAVTLPLQKIEPNPAQPRRDFDEDALDALAESIRLHGVIQPLTVRKMPNGFYQIIAGERRWRAARMAGLEDVPVNVMEADDKKALELALIENLQREDLNPIEEALGYQELMDAFRMTQEQAAARVGKSRPAVANALRLLTLCPPVQDMIRSGKLSAGHARALAALRTDSEQLAAAQKVAALGLSVRQTEQLCKRMTKSGSRPAPAAPLVDYLAECEKDLSRTFGRKVRIVSGRRKGHVELEYYGPEDLQRLYEALQSLNGKERS